jgi:hypothetical protein
MDNPFEDINMILKCTPEEAKSVMEEAKRRRAANIKSTGASKTNAQRSLSCIPQTVYWALTLKYGKHIWSDKKFMKEFWDTYDMFRACEKY